MKHSLVLSLACIGLLTTLYSSPAHSQPDATPQETEVETLRRKVAQQGERIDYLEKTADGEATDGTALKAPFGRLLLVKDGTQCLALQIIEHVDFDKGEKSKSKYRWWLQPDGSLDFTKPNVTQGQGELCEYRNGEDTGEDFIRVGDFNLMWSLSDWIYFPDPEHIVKQDNIPHDNGPQDRVQMAITELVRPEDTQAHSKNLSWHSAPKPKSAPKNPIKIR